MNKTRDFVTICGKIREILLIKTIEKFHEIIVKAFFISTINEDSLNTIDMQKMFIPQQLLNRPQPYLLMYLITVIRIISIKRMIRIIFDTVKSLPKIVVSLQKINKTNKNLLVAVQDLKIFGIDLFLNRSNLSISLNFIYPKIKLAILMNIHYCVYVCFCR